MHEVKWLASHLRRIPTLQVSGVVDPHSVAKHLLSGCATANFSRTQSDLADWSCNRTTYCTLN